MKLFFTWKRSKGDFLPIQAGSYPGFLFDRGGYFFGVGGGAYIKTLKTHQKCVFMYF